MIRRIALTAVGALVFSAVITPATVHAKPITGSVSCTLTGSAVITPGLPLNSPGNATKKLTTKTTFNGVLTNCTGAQMNTKKGLQIDAGTIVNAVAKTVTAVGQPLPSCTALTTTSTTPTVLKAKVTFTSGGAKLTSSNALLTVGAAVPNPDLSVTFPASGPVKGGAFKGQTVTAAAILDKNILDLQTLCTGGASITFTFNGLLGQSTLDIP